MLRIEQKEKEDKYWGQIVKLKEVNKQLKEQITVSKVEGEDQIRNLNKQRSEDVKHVIVNANMKLEEKCHPLLFRQNIMEVQDFFRFLIKFNEIYRVYKMKNRNCWRLRRTKFMKIKEFIKRMF